MLAVLKEKITKSNYINFIIALIPASFIAGNTIINFNIILLILSVFYLYGKEVFKIKYLLLDKILIGFFLLILFTGAINDISFIIKEAWMPKFYTIMKSIAYLRYLFLYIVLRYLVSKDILNFKLFFITCSFFSIFVALDIFYQFIFGKDIFGFKSANLQYLGGRHFSGPFGDEFIAGGYMQRFSIFSFFTLPIFFREKSKKYLYFLIPILFFIFFMAILISGNRMPVILYLFCLSLIVIFQKQTRKFFFPFIISFIVIFLIILNTNSIVKTNFKNFYNQISQSSNLFFNKELETDSAPPYLKEFVSFYDTWRLNKYIGGGIKTFRYYCHLRENLEQKSKFICNMHPHNYYLEILTETGIFGFLLISIIFVQTLYISIKKKYFSNSKLKYNHIIVPFLFLFITEIFPVKSTGSFFTTGNATYFFLIFALTIALSERYKLIEKR
tara:strand:+ start:28 stop:1356 length:1329 start_codon:yes stop_codon:yes gene_type:complete